MEPSPQSQALADRLRRLRLEHWAAPKLTQRDLAAAIGGEQPLSTATVASWENKSAPKLPPPDRLRAVAQFFATDRSVEAAPCLVPLADFTAPERDAYQKLCTELLALHAAARGTPTEPLAGRSWKFADEGPLTFVCAQLPDDDSSPLAKPVNPNHTELLGFGDLDALVELWGHVRMENPDMKVSYKLASRVQADDLSGHMVIIGGIGWNEVTRRILDLTKLPVTQKDDPSLCATGEVFVAHINGKEKRYLPTWDEYDPTRLVEDVGLIVRMPNPLNSNRTLTMCNGIHSRGVLGAARTLTDKILRASNEHYLSSTFPENQEFGILMRVQVIEGVVMTPDFNIPANILYRWSPSASPAAAPAQARR
jgi:hypothetical protein